MRTKRHDVLEAVTLALEQQWGRGVLHHFPLELIRKGAVHVNGKVCRLPFKRCKVGDCVTFLKVKDPQMA